MTKGNCQTSVATKSIFARYHNAMKVLVQSPLRNIGAGGMLAINCYSIGVHSRKKWSKGACKGIGVLAVFRI